MPGFDPAAYRTEQRRGEPSDRRAAAPDTPSATLAAIRDNHQQHVSVNFPAPGICVSRCAGKWPCEAYRAVAALERVLALADEAREIDSDVIWTPCWDLDPADIREAITSALTGQENDPAPPAGTGERP